MFMKLFFILSSIFLLLAINGCSSLNLSWKKTEQASYNAAVDPLTWAPALGSAVLYTTQYDNDISKYMMEHKPIQCIKISSKDCTDRDDVYRELNSVLTFTTAGLVDDDGNTTKKIKRLVVEESTYILSKSVVLSLETVGKTTPDGRHTTALGSHHALEPFAGSAMTRRNVAQMNIPALGKYTIVGASYYFSSYTALTRIQEGGHSLGDQFVNMAVGNFLGLFMDDMFMSGDNTKLHILPLKDRVEFSLNYHF